MFPLSIFSFVGVVKEVGLDGGRLSVAVCLLL